MADYISSLRLLAIFSVIVVVANGQVIDTNSTNFYNLLWSKKYGSFNLYHTYIFDLLKNTNFGEFLKTSLDEPFLNDTVDPFDALDFDDPSSEQNSTLNKIVSMCGKLRHKESDYISKQCLQDLDFIACTLFDLVRTLKSFIKGDCQRLADVQESEKCQKNLETKLKENIWPIRMLDSFGKLEAGINTGNHMYLGRYSDCKSIFVPRDDEVDKRPFETTYCRATFRIPLPETAAHIARQCGGEDSLINGDNRTCKPAKNFGRLKWGVCAPLSCDTRNMTVLFRFMLPPTKHFCNVTVVCERRPVLYRDYGFVGAMILLAIFASLILTGTIYDLLVYERAVEGLPEYRYTVIKNDKQDHEVNNGAGADIVYHNSKTKTEYYREQKWYIKLIMAFSAYTNTKKIFNTDDNPHELKCAQGLRVLSMAWMICILAHIYIISYIDNAKILPKFIASFWYQLINNGSFVADTFLLLSGFLASYNFFRRTQNASSKDQQIFMAKSFIFRYLRLFPPYLILLFILLFVWKYVIRGPLWTAYFFNACSPLQCLGSVWTNLVFMNNFLKTDSPCLPLTQHLALDVQVWIICYATLLLYTRRGRIRDCLIVWIILIIVSCVYPAIMIALYPGFVPPSLMATADVYSLDKPLTAFYNKIFIIPFSRCQPFIIGMFIAYMFFKHPDYASSTGKKIPTVVWILSIFTCGWVIFGLTGYARGYAVSTAVLVTYAALSRLVWSLGVGAMFYLCLLNKGGIVQWFFTLPFWAPLSRLSYSAFLLSPLVILYNYATSNSTIHMCTYNLIYFSLGCLVLTFLCAFAFHLTFEAPFLNLRKLLISRQYIVYDMTPHGNLGDGPRKTMTDENFLLVSTMPNVENSKT